MWIEELLSSKRHCFRVVLRREGGGCRHVVQSLLSPYVDPCCVECGINQHLGVFAGLQPSEEVVDLRIF